MSYYNIKSVLNNSSLLVEDGDNELVIMGKGIGFNQKKGNKIPKDGMVEKKYYILTPHEDSRNIPNRIYKDALMIVDIFEKELGVEALSEDLSSFVNHVIAMLVRIERKEYFDNPFQNETKAIYHDSFELTEKIAERIHDELSLVIPEAEIGFLTMYTHNMISSHDKSQTYIVNSVLAEISDVLTNKHHISIDKESLTYARFVVHIRFVIQRVLREEELEELSVLDDVYERYQDYVPIADDIARVIENELETTLSKEEKGYILVYIIRLNT